MRFFDREQEFEKIREIEELFHSIPRVELFFTHYNKTELISKHQLHCYINQMRLTHNENHEN